MAKLPSLLEGVAKAISKVTPAGVVRGIIGGAVGGPVLAFLAADIDGYGKKVLDGAGSLIKKITKFIPSDPGYDDTIAEYVSQEEAAKLNDKMRNIPLGRRHTPPNYYDYITYPHRTEFSEYNLRIGDCCLVVPPEFISVKTLSGTESHVGLRQTSSTKSKHGYSKKEIVATLYFNGMDQLNGYEVKSPMDYKYYVDGLRPLLAQFKCTPFLPIINEFINHSCQVYAVALSSISVTAVPGFPECVQVNLIMQEFNCSPYIEHHTAFFDDFFDWDMLRYYYQQLLRKDSTIPTRLIPIQSGNSLTGNFTLSSLKYEVFDSETPDMFAIENFQVEISNVVIGARPADNIEISDISFSTSNILPTIQMSDHSSPTHQFLGGMDTNLSITLETLNEKIAAQFSALNTAIQANVRDYREFNGMGFVRIDNELINLSGVKYLMIDSLAINTVPDFPGLTSITLECISYEETQHSQEGLKGMRPFEGDRLGTKADGLKQTREGAVNKAKQDGIIESKLMDIELFPDLHLPMHKEVNEAITKIRYFRTINNLTQLGYDMYPRSYSMVPGQGPHGEYAVYMEPDFYLFYPLKYTDTDLQVLKDTLGEVTKPTASKVTVPEHEYGDEVPKGAKINKDGGVTWDESVSQDTSTTTSAPVSAKTGNRFADLLLTQVGKPYVWATDGLDGQRKVDTYDCSGLICWGLRKLGIAPAGYREADTGVMNSYTTPITKDQLRPGDLCNNPGVHIVCYIGNGKTVEAMGKDYGVCIGNVENRGFSRYGRIKGMDLMQGEDANSARYTEAARRSGVVTGTGVTCDRLNEFLKGGLANQGKYFIQKEQETGVDAVLAVTICIAEEGRTGTTPHVLENHNPSGQMRGSTNIHYDSIEQGIDATFATLQNLISNGGSTIQLLGDKYCPVGADNDPNGYNKEWVGNVTSIYKEISQGEAPSKLSTTDIISSQYVYDMPKISQAGQVLQNGTKDFSADTAGEPIYDLSPINYSAGGTRYDDAIGSFKVSKEDRLSKMLVDEVTYGMKGHLSRAFPTFLMLICDDGGEWLNARKLWTNFYTYKSVIDISVFSEESQPVSAVTITISDVYRNLNKAQKSHNVREAIKDDSEYNGIQKWWYNWCGSLLGTPKLTQSMVDMKNELFDNINLKTGTRIHIRMGYGSNPLMLPICFNGVISEVNTGEIITIVAQSDGAELVNNSVSYDEKAVNGVTKLQSEPSDIISSLLTDRYSFWENVVCKDWGEKSKYGIEHFGIYAGHQLLKHREYDLCKNVYYGKYNCRPFCHDTITVFDGEKNLNFYLLNKTPWDAAQITTQFLPEFVCQPMYHQFDSRLFYGVPSWIAKYRYDYKATGEVCEYGKVFGQLHFLDSLTDIIDNQVRVSSQDIHTNMIGSYTLGSKITSTPVIYSDRSIDWAMQKTKLIDTTIVQDYVGWDKFYEHMPFISLDVGKSAAIKIVISNLIDGWANSYQDPIIILGNSTIKPCDYIFINDTHAELKGMATAREVIHSFSIDTGFTTSIIPSLIATNNMSNSGMTNILKSCTSCGLATGALVGLRHMGIKGLFRLADVLGVSKTLNVMLRTGSFAMEMPTVSKVLYESVKTGRIVSEGKTVSTEIKTALTVARTASKARDVEHIVDGVKITMVAAGSEFPVVGNIAMWIISDIIFDCILTDVMDLFIWDNCISLHPLIYKGNPFVSGCRGFSALIPGYKDKDNSSDYIELDSSSN